MGNTKIAVLARAGPPSNVLSFPPYRKQVVHEMLCGKSRLILNCWTPATVSSCRN